MTRRSAVVVVMMLVSLAAVAQQSRVYQRGNLWVGEEELNGGFPYSPTVIIRMYSGAVNVSGTDQQSISYRIRKFAHSDSETETRQRLEQLRILARRIGGIVVFEAQYNPDVQQHGRIEVNVFVPRATKMVKVNMKSGTEYVAGIDGGADVSLSGGRLRLENIGGPVSAFVGAGVIDIGSVGGDLSLNTDAAKVAIKEVRGNIRATSGGGPITIGSAAQNVIVQTGSGDIDIQRCGGELRATTGGGSLDLGQINGRAILQTAGGSIRIGSANGPVSASTGGGTIQLWGLAQGASVRTGQGGQITAEFLNGSFPGSTLQTPSGDVVVYLCPSLKLSVRASIGIANGHRVVSSFPEIKSFTEGGQYGGPRTAYAEGSLNGGGPLLRVSTVSGNIEFRASKRK